MSPPAPDRVPYLRLVWSAEAAAREPLPVRPLGVWLRVALLVETLRRRRARNLSVERLSDHERRDIGLGPVRPDRDPRDLILRL